MPFLPIVPSGSMKVEEFGVFSKEISMNVSIFDFSMSLNDAPSVTVYFE